MKGNQRLVLTSERFDFRFKGGQNFLPLLVLFCAAFSLLFISGSLLFSPFNSYMNIRSLFLHFLYLKFYTMSHVSRALVTENPSRPYTGQRRNNLLCNLCTPTRAAGTSDRNRTILIQDSPAIFFTIIRRLGCIIRSLLYNFHELARTRNNNHFFCDSRLDSR